MPSYYVGPGHCPLHVQPLSMVMTVYYLYSTLCTVHYILFTLLCILYTVNSGPYTVQCTLCTVNCSQNTVHSELYTVNSQTFSLHLSLIYRFFIVFTVYCLLNKTQCQQYNACCFIDTMY